MSLATRIDVSEDISELLANFHDAVVDNLVLMKRIGLDVTILFQEHYRSLPPNRQFPGQSTHFWADAARSTHYQAAEDHVDVITSKVGVLQQLLGGDITPGADKKFLTIPAREEAYGHVASDFNNLRFIKTRSGGMLVEEDVNRVKIRRQKKDGSRSVRDLGEYGGGVMFWLVKRVHQVAHPDIVPNEARIGEVVLLAVRDHLSLLAGGLA